MVANFRYFTFLFSCKLSVSFETFKESYTMSQKSEKEKFTNHINLFLKIQIVVSKPKEVKIGTSGKNRVGFTEINIFSCSKFLPYFNLMFSYLGVKLMILNCYVSAEL